MALLPEVPWKDAEGIWNVLVARTDHSQTIFDMKRRAVYLIAMTGVRDKSPWPASVVGTHAIDTDTGNGQPAMIFREIVPLPV